MQEQNLAKDPIELGRGFSGPQLDPSLAVTMMLVVRTGLLTNRLWAKVGAI